MQAVRLDAYQGLCEWVFTGVRAWPITAAPIPELYGVLDVIYRCRDDLSLEKQDPDDLAIMLPMFIYLRRERS